MIETLKPLMESGLLNEATLTAVNEAWENKVKDLQTTIRTEIREEFSTRYSHDKASMIKALDKMVSETLTAEVTKIKEGQIQVSKLKVKAVKEMKDAAKKFNTFLTHALAEELAQFAHERKLQESHKAKLERFVMSSLAEEISEFSQDKQALTETRVKLVTEAKTQLETLKKKFVARSSQAVSAIVAETLNHEITQLHEDIKVAKQNTFGRKIYEAFASEFGASYLNENAEAKKFQTKIAALTTELKEAKVEVNNKKKLVESKMKEVKTLQERANREKIVGELLAPLDKSKKAVMGQLLESIQTVQLRSAYDKYLPSVLNNRNISAKSKSVLSESTGSKTGVMNDEDNTLNEILNLAGLKK
jgi:hypothetical protein